MHFFFFAATNFINPCIIFSVFLQLLLQVRFVFVHRMLGSFLLLSLLCSHTGANQHAHMRNLSITALTLCECSSSGFTFDGLLLLLQCTFEQKQVLRPLFRDRKSTRLNSSH